MKIFGIGLPKTATTSLAAAMETLGYTSVHFPLSEEEIDTSDFICNGNICARYAELDQKYPNSKFIVSLRDDDSWLLSIQKHFARKPTANLLPSRKELRHQLWGSVTPSAKKLLSVKRQHEHDVRTYFADRPQDVLYLNIIDGDSWNKLCDFLNKEIPDTEFPKKNVASN